MQPDAQDADITDMVISDMDMTAPKDQAPDLPDHIDMPGLDTSPDLPDTPEDMGPMLVQGLILDDAYLPGIRASLVLAGASSPLFLAYHPTENMGTLRLHRFDARLGWVSVEIASQLQWRAGDTSENAALFADTAGARIIYESHTANDITLHSVQLNTATWMMGQSEEITTQLNLGGEIGFDYTVTSSGAHVLVLLPNLLRRYTRQNTGMWTASQQSVTGVFDTARFVIDEEHFCGLDAMSSTLECYSEAMPILPEFDEPDVTAFEVIRSAMQTDTNYLVASRSGLGLVFGELRDRQNGPIELQGLQWKGLFRDNGLPEGSQLAFARPDANTITYQKSSGEAVYSFGAIMQEAMSDVTLYNQPLTSPASGDDGTLHIMSSTEATAPLPTVYYEAVAPMIMTP